MLVPLTVVSMIMAAFSLSCGVLVRVMDRLMGVSETEVTNRKVKLVRALPVIAGLATMLAWFLVRV